MDVALRITTCVPLTLFVRGDYRTGKRLNMRRIIPYIASNFQNDRIWLRRAKPSKREYQILIAVDDSSSMTENNCNQVRQDIQVTRECGNILYAKSA